MKKPAQMKKERRKAMARYDKQYCMTPEHFKDKTCRHRDVQQYNAKGSSKKLTAIQSVCIRCGRISKWTKTTNHTVGGGFEYNVQF